MTRTKTPAASRSRKPAPNKNGALPAGDVLTLAEAAAYLRVAEDEVLRMIPAQGLPGRQFGTEWRFLKPALQGWLSVPSAKKRFWDTHFGALKDDPYLEEMLTEIYRRRGRPMTEEG